MSFSVQAGGLKFVRCRSCGCVICWQSPGKGRDERMGINTRLLDHTLMADVPIRVLDGDMPWRSLGTYVKPDMWISPHRERARRAKSRRLRESPR